MTSIDVGRKFTFCDYFFLISKLLLWFKKRYSPTFSRAMQIYFIRYFIKNILALCSMFLWRGIASYMIVVVEIMAFFLFFFFPEIRTCIPWTITRIRCNSKSSVWVRMVSCEKQISSRYQKGYSIVRRSVQQSWR